MTGNLSAIQARTISTSDLVIYNEIDAVFRAVMAAALAGELTVSVNDGTVMTESSPIITVTGTEVNPIIGMAAVAFTFTDGNVVNIPAESDIYQIVGLINDAGIAGLTASYTADYRLVLTYETSPGAWSFAIGANTANAEVGITAGVVAAVAPESTAYYAMWAGITESRKRSYEFAQVINHFQNLGYNIVAKKNVVTQNTIFWELYW